MRCTSVAARRCPASEQGTGGTWGTREQSEPEIKRVADMRMSRRTFEALVERALGTIPAELRGRMDNVEIVVDAWPDEGHYATVGLEPRDTPFGLFDVVPLIEGG